MYNKDNQYYKDQIPERNPVLAHTLAAALNLSAPRLLQRIPSNPLPGVTFIIGYTNIPRRIAQRRNVANLMPNPYSGIVPL